MEQQDAPAYRFIWRARAGLLNGVLMAKRVRILIVDPEIRMREAWSEHFKRCDVEIVVAVDASDIHRWCRASQPGLVGIVTHSDWQQAIMTARSVRLANKSLPIILLVYESSERLAIEALHANINDYFQVPEEIGAVVKAIERFGESGSDGGAITASTRAQPSALFPSMIGDSELMRNVKSRLLRVAVASSNILITGETGTGKELAATAIHRMSSRRERPFVCVNCAAIPDTLVESEIFGYERGAFTGANASRAGQLEQAAGGTLFLDEVGDLSSYAQAKLLRVVEMKEFRRLGGKSSVPVDVRFVAATNRNLEEMTARREFREDLYFRLNIARLHLPPLRERKEDIPQLVAHYIQELNNRDGREIDGLEKQVLKRLISYQWPGNIRELKNLLESAFIDACGRNISFEDLPEEFQQRLNGDASAVASEHERLLSALLDTQWNKSKAAAKLNWSRMTLYRKLTKYKLTSVSTREKVPH